MVTIPEIFSTAHAHHKGGRLAEAEALYRQILQADPRHTDALNLLGVIGGQTGNLEQGARYIGKAIQLDPGVAEYHSNLGEIYRTLGRTDDAISCFEYALRLKPDLVEAQNNVGIALQDVCRPDEAMPHYDEAIRLKPDYVEARWNRSLCLLLTGRFEEGWTEYDWRWRVSSLPPLRPGLNEQFWRGEPWTGGPLLLHSEQGLGDSIQFARFIPLVARRGPVVVEVEPDLIPLFGSLGVPLIAKGPVPPAHVRQCPLMSLPRALGINLRNLPADIPYLRAPSDETARWCRHFAGSGGLRVGLTWRGRPDHRNDRRRSMPIEHARGLGRIGEVAFFGIQKGASAAEIAPLQADLNLTLLDGLADFGETAGAIEALDLIITVDTSIAHVAGALGKPVWLLTSFSPDWRWLLGIDYSPWYPTMRVFRQKRLGDWAGLMAEVEAELARVAAGDRDRLFPDSL